MGKGGTALPVEQVNVSGYINIRSGVSAVTGRRFVPTVTRLLRFLFACTAGASSWLSFQQQRVGVNGKKSILPPD
jgi:hypothetical protein